MSYSPSYSAQYPTNAIRGFAIVAAFVFVGWALLHASHAGTFAAAEEAENGIVTGNAGAIASTGASGSGNNAVKFGVAMPSVTGTDITTYGAVCDGVNDDTVRIQAALDATQAGQTLQIPSGKVCVHSDILTLKNAGMHLAGPGTLMATNYKLSVVQVAANDVTIEGNITFKLSDPLTVRTAGDFTQKLSVDNVSGAIIRDVTIDGSAATGIRFNSASNYLLENATVIASHADGIHSTHGSHDGTIRNVTVTGNGDDGVSVVSYQKDPGPCYNITVDHATVRNNYQGRGLTVVGGHDITFTNFLVDGSNVAALYVAIETAFPSYNVSNIRYSTGTILNANTKTTVDHGAVVIANQLASPSLIDTVLMENINIQNTRADVSSQVSLRPTGGPINRVQLKNFTITGGPSTLFKVGTTPAANYSATGWTY